MNANSAFRRAIGLAAGIAMGVSALASGSGPAPAPPPSALASKMAIEFEASAAATRERIDALEHGDARSAELAEHVASLHRARYLALRAQQISTGVDADAGSRPRSPFTPDFTRLTRDERPAGRTALASWDLYANPSRSTPGAHPASGASSPWGMYESRVPGNAVPLPPGEVQETHPSSDAANPYLVYRAPRAEVIHH